MFPARATYTADSNGNITGLAGSAGPAQAFRSIDTLSVGKLVTDAVVSSGTKNVTSATAGFTSADVGKIFAITNPANGSQTYSGTIASVTNSTTFVSSGSNAAASWSSGVLAYGTDNAAALQALLNAAASTTLNSSLVELPGGVFMLGTGVTVPDGVTLRGVGHNYNVYSGPEYYGTGLFAGGSSPFATSYLVKVGVLGTGASPHAAMGAKIEQCNVNGSNFVSTVVYHHGWCAEIWRCHIWGAPAGGAAVYYDANVGKIMYSGIAQQNQGDCLSMVTPRDAWVVGNIINGAAGASSGSPAALVRMAFPAAAGSGGDVWFTDNHIWQEKPLNSNSPAHGVWLQPTSGGLGIQVHIERNVFDTNYGHAVLLDLDSTSTMLNLSVKGNSYYINDTSFPDNTYDVVRVNTVSGSVLAGVQLEGNRGWNASGSTNSYANLYNFSGAGTVYNDVVIGNAARMCNRIVPAGYKVTGGNIGNTVANNAGTVLQSQNRGRSTQSGNGATVVFNIAHGLGDTPIAWSVVPRVALAAPNFIVTADATNLIVTYATAPPNTANNVDLTWTATL